MSKKKVLIIENNKEIRENTAEILELNNYKVLSAKTGSTGFDLAKQFLPDLILCDIMKPETESRIFFKHASQDETILQIPIILFRNVIQFRGWAIHAIFKFIFVN